MVIARKQTLVQLTDELVDLLDRRAAREDKSRSAVIREAIEAHLRDEIEAEIGRQIAEGYRRMPETDEELEWADIGLEEELKELDEYEEESW
jgi:metal-responsive CopG/Arc/MetJ family transcriptional regulator